MLTSESSDRIELSIIELNSGRQLKPRNQPFLLAIAKVSKKGLLIAEIPEIGHSLGGYSPSELREVVEEHIASMWEDYCAEPDENLKLGIPEIKRWLLLKFEEVSHRN